MARGGSTEGREGIVVLGIPRSGTTLVRRLLDAHPSISCPGETFLFSSCARFIEADQVKSGLDIGCVSLLQQMGFPEEDVLRRLREFAFAFHREHLVRTGKRRWAEKSVMDVFHLEAIERLLGDHVAFVVVERHGLDVVASLIEMTEKSGGPLTELHSYLQRYRRWAEAYARLWAELTTDLRDFAERRENVILLQYERLIADPDAELERLFAFLGEEHDLGLVRRALQDEIDVAPGDWKTYGRLEIDAASRGRWKKDLSRSDLHAAVPIVNPVLARCGYEEVPLPDKPDPASERRRYLMGLQLRSRRRK
jgi:hypothetical protein